MVVGYRAAEEASKGINEVLRNFSVQTSPKPKANLPFSTRFDTLGAHLDMRYPTKIIFSPSKPTIEKFRREVKELRDQVGKVLPRKQIEKLIWLLALITRFTPEHALSCNSAFESLRVRPSTRMLSAILLNDAIRDAFILLGNFAKNYCRQ